MASQVRRARTMQRANLQIPRTNNSQALKQLPAHTANPYLGDSSSSFIGGLSSCHLLHFAMQSHRAACKFGNCVLGPCFLPLAVSPPCPISILVGSESLFFEGLLTLIEHLDLKMPYKNWLRRCRKSSWKRKHAVKIGVVNEDLLFA